VEQQHGLHFQKQQKLFLAVLWWWMNSDRMGDEAFWSGEKRQAGLC
jgi:hypothetical protein